MKKMNIFFTFSWADIFSFFNSLHFANIVSSQNENNSAYIDLLLGKCLYKAASVIFDFSARDAVVILDKFFFPILITLVISVVPSKYWAPESINNIFLFLYDKDLLGSGL